MAGSFVLVETEPVEPVLIILVAVVSKLVEAILIFEKVVTESQSFTGEALVTREYDSWRFSIAPPPKVNSKVVVFAFLLSGRKKDDMLSL